MDTIRFSQMLETLSGLDLWIEEIGLRPKNDRIHHVIEVVRQAEEGFQKARSGGQPAKIGNVEDYHFGMTEALEFCDIFQAFQNENPEVIRPKLERALSGPIRPIQENQSNADGRNVMFELSLAAGWRLRGADVSLGEPDLILRLNDIPFLVACKRPAAEHSIRANIRGAAEQLSNALTHETFSGAFGLIAISVSRVLNRGDKIFVAPNEEGRHRLGDIITKLLQENEHGWLRLDFHSRVVAVLFCATTPAAIEDKDILAKMSYSVVKSIGREGPAFNLLKEELAPFFEQ